MLNKKGALGIIGGAALGVFLLGMVIGLANYSFSSSSKSLQLSPDMGGVGLFPFLTEPEENLMATNTPDDIEFPGGVSMPGAKGSCKCTSAKTAKFRVYCANKDDPKKPSNYMKEVYSAGDGGGGDYEGTYGGETLTYEDATPETATQFDVEGQVKTVTPAPSCDPDAKVDECKASDTCENVADPTDYMTYYAEGVSKATGRACGANLVPGSQTGGAARCDKQ